MQCIAYGKRMEESHPSLRDSLLWLESAAGFTKQERGYCGLWHFFVNMEWLLRLEQNLRLRNEGAKTEVP